MKVVVIDDEKNSRELLKTLLTNYCPEVKEVHIASSVNEAIKVINLNDPDLIFLDIEMPEANGFELLDAFSDARFLTCFTTGYEEYAIKAIKYKAFGYLLKPLDLEELKEVVIKAADSIKGQDRSTPILLLVENNTYNAVKYSDILFIEGSGNYTSLHVSDGKTLLSQENLTHFEEILPESAFFRVHRSYIVNIPRISTIREGRTGVAIMNNSKEIPIANRRLKQFMHAFKTYY